MSKVRTSLAAMFLVIPGASLATAQYTQTNLVADVPVGPVGTPTGIVANTTQDFVISNDGKSGPARFIFDTIDGLICGWNPDVDPDHAITVIDYSAAKPKA